MFHARRSSALLKKLNLDTGQTLTPFGLERGFLTQVLEKKRNVEFDSLPWPSTDGTVAV